MALDLSFPRRPYVEAYLNGWVSLTADVRQATGIKIDRGRANESTAPSPSKCTFVLDDGPEHGNGKYSPRNPLGQYFGTLGRNNPVRVGLEVGKDAFTRSVGSGWGSSPQNGAWTTGAAGSSVSSNEGRHTLSSANTFTFNYLDTIDVRDIDVAVSVTIDSVSNVTGGDLEPGGIMLRAQSTSSFYLVRMVVTSAEVVQLRIMLNDTTTLAGPVTLSTAYTGQQWRIRVNMEQGHIMAKAWPTSTTEPLDWQIGSVRENPLDGGWVGIRSGRGLGNTNTNALFRYDDFELRLPRFTGELAGFRPSTSLNHSVREVAVECGGISRRVLKYEKLLESPVRRWLLNDSAATPTQYWPLEELSTASKLGANVIGNGPAAQFVRGTGGGGPAGAIKWGTTDNIPPSIVACPEVTAGGQLVIPVPSLSTNTTAYTVSWGQRISADAGARLWLRTAGNSGSSGWQIIIYTNGNLEVYELTTGTLQTTTSLQSMNLGFDNVWHACTFAVTANGGNTDFILYIDNVGVGATAVPQALTKLRQIELTSELNTTAPSAYSHVAVCSTPIDQTDYWEAFTGWGAAAPSAGFLGEPFLTRFIRLCNEQGISYSYVGSETGAPDVKMGPQTPAAVGELLKQCADRDAATLYEPRSLPAIAIRRTYTLFGQTPRVTLDYAGSHIAPVFAPVDDDLDPVNDVTVKSSYTGVEARYEKTTGANNVSDPGTAEGAAGRYEATVTITPNLDTQLQQMAEWLGHLGTVDEPRYPKMTVDFSGSGITNAIASAVLDLNVDDAVTIENLSDTLVFDDVRQIARGYSEVFDTAYRHLITFNLSPASPYDVMEIGAAQWLGTDDTTLNEALDTTETGVDITIASGGAPWTVADQPFDINIGGERMTVTGLAGSTLTVTRHVNGVVDTHSIGDRVSVADPFYLALEA